MAGPVRRRLLTAALLAGLASAWGVAASDVPALPPLERCQAESLQLKAALVEWQARAIAAEARLAQAQLVEDRRAWELRVRAQLQVPAGAVFNWTTYQFDDVTRP